MCIICLEFNKNRDIWDAQTMIEAARREVNVIPEDHLKRVENELKQRAKTASGLGAGSAEKPEELKID